jgi:preprotein translocase subunit SecB
MSMEHSQKHPIQLTYIGVKELVAKTYCPPKPDVGIPVDEENSYKIQVGYPGYNTGEKNFVVFLMCTIGEDGGVSGAPIFLKVEIAGFFDVDTEKFNINEIDHFALKNAPTLMMPFLRSYLYNLSASCGIKPIILPLIQLPIFRREDLIDSSIIDSTIKEQT